MPTETFRPNGAGDETNIPDLVPDSGEENWENVDEVISDGNTTRVSNTSLGYKRDLYNIAVHSVGSGTINFIKVYANSKAQAVTPNQPSLKIAIKTGGTVYESSEIELSSTYELYLNQWTTNPGGGAWTWADIDALQIGIAVRRCIVGESLYSVVTQVYVVVNYTVDGGYPRQLQVPRRAKQ